MHIPELGDIKLYKRKGARQMRLSIGSNGEVRVTLPHWTPYAAGVAFAASKQAWISQNRPQKQHMEPYMHIGKAVKLFIVRDHAANKIRTTMSENYVRITIPLDTNMQSSEVQAAARKAAVKSLKNQAEAYLPGRLKQLAELHGFTYRSTKIKQLKGRWGSCSSHKDITLNCFLMQLPDNLIDYVLLHELTHTKIMAHGKPFWTEMARYVTNLPAVRQQMKTYRPDVVNMQ